MSIQQFLANIVLLHPVCVDFSELIYTFPNSIASEQ